jgi:site-specific recombinase XerD
VVQGVDTRASWQRYLQLEGEHEDLRNVGRTIRWIRDEFAAAARREAHPGLARLVLIDVSKIPESEAELPTLDVFAAEHGLEEFTQAEQLEQYRETYGSALQRQARRQRLIERQLEALTWLERLVARPPSAGDAVAAWLNPDLAIHLEASGIVTLRELAERINGVGRGWWRAIPAVGATKAARILAWLRTHEASLNLRIGAHVELARRSLQGSQLARIVPKATAILPLEKFLVPTELDGAAGLYRAPRAVCLISAKNDYEAILTWVKAKHGMSEAMKRAVRARRGGQASAAAPGLEWLGWLSNTQRAYLKEAERFLLWAILERKKPLSSMTLEDCTAYREFLANPTPAAQWCGPRSRGRWSVLWRPFEGPLSASAQRHAITILRTLYKFLVDQCYLTGNPWNGVTVPKRTGARVNAGRSFTQAQWDFIMARLALLDMNSANRRLTFAMHLLYATGLRLIEVVSAQVDDLRQVSYPQPGDEPPIEGWLLRVIGKGEKERHVPVPADVVVELAGYLSSRGLHPDPEVGQNAGAFLLGKAIDAKERAPWSPSARTTFEPKAGIAPGTLYDQLKRFFCACAEALAPTDAKGSARLQSASTHWLRHTHGSHAVAAGTELDVVQQNLGHASLNTTTIYTTSEESRRMKSMQKFWAKARL